MFISLSFLKIQYEITRECSYFLFGKPKEKGFFWVTQSKYVSILLF